MSYATWPIDPHPLWPALTLKLKRSEKSKNFSPEKTKKSINIHSAFGTSFTYFCLRKKLFPCFSLSHLHPSQGAFFSAFLLTAERQEQKNTTTHCSCISITSASFIHFLVARVKDDALKTLRVPYCLFGFIAEGKMRHGNELRWECEISWEEERESKITHCYLSESSLRVKNHLFYYSISIR